MGELRLESGESIRDFCLSYVTHGTLNAGRSNAVLMASVVALIPLARTPAWSTGITEMLRIDANDWLYQSWAYDAHNVGTTPGFNGDYRKALRSIKAKVLIMAGTGDLLNPEYEAREAASYITDARYVAINEARPLGHISAADHRARERPAERRDRQVPRSRDAARQADPVAIQALTLMALSLAGPANPIQWPTLR
jgi:hypothetical protein